MIMFQPWETSMCVVIDYHGPSGRRRAVLATSRMVPPPGPMGSATGPTYIEGHSGSTTELCDLRLRTFGGGPFPG